MLFTVQEIFIQWILQLVSLTLMRWTVIYPVDSITLFQLLNNWGEELVGFFGTYLLLCSCRSWQSLENLKSQQLEILTWGVVKLTSWQLAWPLRAPYYEFTSYTTRFARWCASFIIVMLVCVCRRHVIVLGDINTAHKMIDHCDPDEEVKNGAHWINSLFSGN